MDERLVELRAITKAFPGVVANDRVDLDIHAGEVHALLGENGAGKSTLISVLSGMYRPDAGEIRIAGRPVEIGSPRQAIELGIGTVYQHLTLVPTLTVLQNLLLGADGLRLDLTAARARFAELSALLGADVPADAPVGGLALGRQQQVEIMKALWRDSRVLVLDEPTSMLTPRDYAQLRDELERLKARGLAIVLITHKLHEAIELGDRVSILRGGRKVGALAPEELRQRGEDELREEIVRIMFGEEAPAAGAAPELAVDAGGGRLGGEREAAGSLAGERDEGGRLGGGPPAPAHEPREGEPGGGRVALELRDVDLSGEPDQVGLRGVSLQLRAGEVLGMAGVDGNGQRELAEVVAGQRRPDAGAVFVDGEDVTGLGVAERQRRGLRYVTDDRLGEGTVGSFDVAMNAVLKRIGQAPFWVRGRVRRSAIERHARELVEAYDVRPRDVRARTATLSGGNVQKLVLARELAFSPRIVVFNKPTHGLDVKTAEFVRRQIRAQAQEGIAALVISTELDELIALCDRIGVLSRGALAGVVDNGTGAEERIGALMVSR